MGQRLNCAEVAFVPFQDKSPMAWLSARHILGLDFWCLSHFVSVIIVSVAPPLLKKIKTLLSVSSLLYDHRFCWLFQLSSKLLYASFKCILRCGTLGKFCLHYYSTTMNYLALW
jgi:hypothetical protein